MTIHIFFFYLIAAAMIGSTLMAVTRNNMVHAVIYLVVSFLSSGMLFYLLGAPLIAAMEVIIYAGAIMVLFLFIVMMIKVTAPKYPTMTWTRVVGTLAFCALFFVFCAFMIYYSPETAKKPMQMAMASPAAFGHFLFSQQWLDVELVSLLLLVALIGALHLGKSKASPNSSTNSSGGEPK